MRLAKLTNALRVAPSRRTWFLLTMVTAAIACFRYAVAQPGPSVMTLYEDPQPVSKPPTQQTTELIGELANPSAEKRAQAARALLGIGPDVEAQLQWVLEKETSSVAEDDVHIGGDVEARSAYEPGKALPRLAYHELVVLTDRLGERRRAVPSIITLRYKDARVTDVLRDFGRQRGAGLRIVDPSTRPLDWIAEVHATIDIERASYWDALRAIRREWGFGGMDSLVPSARMFEKRDLVPDTERSPFDVPGATRAGPLLVAPWSVETRHKQNASARDDEGVVLTLRAIAEPKVRAGQHAIVEIDEVSDDTGRSLLGADGRTFYSVRPETSREIGPRSTGDINDRWQWEIPVRLASSASGRRIAVVRGRLGVGVGPPGQTLTMTGLDKGVWGHSLQFDGVAATASVVQGQFARGNYHVAVTISAPAGGPIGRTVDEEGSGYSFVNSLGLLDEARKEVRREAEFVSVDRGAERVTLSGSLTPIDAASIPVTLMWGTPAETRWFKVPFELRDIPIPSSK